MYLLNKYRFIFVWAIIGGLIFSASYAYSQEIISERPIIYEKGVKKSDAVTVNFKEKVLDLPIGKRKATISDIQSDFQEVIKYFEDLSIRYGEISLYKQIPPAKWGDVWRRNRRTGEMVQIHEWSQLFSIRFTQFVPIEEIVNELFQLEVVEYAHQPIQVMPLSDPPNDTFYNSTDQWNLFKIEAEKAWDITHASSDIVVAVIDAGGFQPSHVDLRNKFVEGDWDTTGTGSYENHGTEVAGVIGAETNNQNGIASLGWNIMMIPYAFFQYDTLKLVAHIDSAKSYPVDIINCSFVLLKGSCPAGLDDYVDVKDIIADAINQGIIVVAGTGNRAYHGCDFPFVPYPAAYADVIGVAATDKNDEHPEGYNYKGIEMLQFIDVAAPGDSIKTTHDLPNVYDEIDGTSVAAPHVSALAGLMLSVNPDLSPSDVEHIIEETAKDLNNRSYFGKGRINAYEALRYTLENYGGTLSGNVLLHGDLTIKSGATLVIESGTTITFAANQDDQSSGLDNARCELTIQGKIEADGVTFTSSSFSANSWYGIVLDGAAATSYIKNSTIKYARRGIIVDDCSPTHGIITYYNFILCASMSS